MKKHLFSSLLVFMLCWHSSVRARPNIHFNFQRSIQLNINVNDRIVYTQYKGDIYYTRTNLGGIGDTRDSMMIRHVVYKLNLAGGTIDSLYLPFPATATATGWSADDIAIDDKYIAVVMDSTYLFTNGNAKVPSKFITAINSMHCYSAWFADTDRLVFRKIYNNHPKDDSVNTKLLLYDISKRAIVKYIHPEFNYISYTHLVNNFTDKSDEYIAIAQTIPYKIKLLRLSSFEEGAELHGNDFSNDPTVIHTIDSLDKGAYKTNGIKEVLYAMRKTDSISRIEKVHFLDNDHIIVSKTVPNGRWERRLIDVWQRKGKSWRLVVTDQLEQMENNSDYTITAASFPLNLTYSDKMMFANGHIYQLSTKVGPAMNITSSDYKKQMDSFYETNPLNYYLWDYTWTIK